MKPNPPDSPHGSLHPAPGRVCPLHYRYPPAALAHEPDIQAETLYVLGGLYGNRHALATALDLSAGEKPAATLVFNGDFHWFDTDDAGFSAIDDEVLRHHAIRGNVETEIAGDDEDSDCGCGYPEWVSDAEVARSNEIIARLRETARRHPQRRGRLARLPMHVIAQVAGMRIAIVHGDAESLAGWNFSQESLATSDGAQRLPAWFEHANARVFASSHTCLPVMTDCESAGGRCVLANNGAAGMPNFAGTTFGLLTRIAATKCNVVDPVYGTRLGPLHIDALPLRYPQALWLDEFLGNWPPLSAAHVSYFHRIANGPGHNMEQAIRWRVSSPGATRPTAVGIRGAN